MKVPTNELKEAMQFLKLGISTEKSKPMATSLVELSTHQGYLYGYAFDEMNFLRVKICEVDEDFEAALTFDLLSGFVKDAHCDEIEFTINDKGVRFKSSTISSQMVNFGRVIPHPKTHAAEDTISKEDADTYLNLSKIRPIIDKTHPVPCYQNVYFGDKGIVCTGGACDNGILTRKKLFNKDIILSYKQLEILNALGGFSYAIEEENANNLHRCHLFVNNGDRVVYMVTADMTDFQYQDYIDLFDAPLPYSVEINDFNGGLNAATLLKLEKLYLVFGPAGVLLYIKTHDFKYRLSETPCEKANFSTNVEMLRKLLSLGNSFTLHYALEYPKDEDGVESPYLKAVGELSEEVISVVKVDKM